MVLRERTTQPPGPAAGSPGREEGCRCFVEPPADARLIGSARVLVVDDLDPILEFARLFLLAAGYDVLVATSAEEALTVFESETVPIDLLFTDFNMTGKTGQQLIDEVSVRWPKTRFILASGNLEQNERHQIERSYGAHILDKPYHVREAISLIAGILRR